jgi:hypothetical protein
VDAEDATELARDFGRDDSALSLSADLGLTFGPVEALGSGIARARLLPDPSFRAWARSGAPASAIPLDARADLLGAAVYAFPTIGVGAKFTRPGGANTVYAGIRVKPMRGVYSHYVVTGANIQNDTDALKAPEMNGDDTLDKTGLGIDVGVLVQPQNSPNGFSAAVVLTNLIQPGLKFRGTDRTGAAKTYDLQPSTISLGTAFRAGNALIAFDLVDIRSAYGDTDARIGAEFKAAGRLALRAGYSSDTGGLTYGVGLAGLDLAFGSKTPVAISRTLNF